MTDQAKHAAYFEDGTSGLVDDLAAEWLHVSAAFKIPKLDILTLEEYKKKFLRRTEWKS